MYFQVIWLRIYSYDVINNNVRYDLWTTAVVVTNDKQNMALLYITNCTEKYIYFIKVYLNEWITNKKTYNVGWLNKWNQDFYLKLTDLAISTS